MSRHIQPLEEAPEHELAAQTPQVSYAGMMPLAGNALESPRTGMAVRPQGRPKQGARQIKSRVSASLGPNGSIGGAGAAKTEGPADNRLSGGGSKGLTFDESVYARKNGKKMTTLSQQRRQIPGIGP